MDEKKFVRRFLFLLVFVIALIYIGNSISTLFSITPNSGKVCYSNYGCLSNQVCCKAYNYEEGFCTSKATCEVLKNDEKENNLLSGFIIKDNLFYENEKKMYWPYMKEVAYFEFIFGLFILTFFYIVYRKTK